ncbi:efflux RND transporter periplasmic adaptor subunit [Ovoidimarina sediminis]|uniref:efflux RND transporter periplasmic adaptor subunit n=1 Tax=Ovoidimarina sediminis TaxID=3079856 RepID=UPI00290E12C8|nr:efflux RND transporter periplasmic adaptor subunit [Rhodophyticola sp. MJ-SS7]MDU8944991.1 efflux RND transporter periplasmic adaptor subunit [Rhodophyticola sp. MJ-SS7]
MTDTSSHSLLFRVARRAAILIGTTSAVAIAGALAYSGAGTLAARADLAPTVAAAPPLPVTTASLVLADSYTIRTEYSGRVEARQRTAIGFEQGGTIAALPLDEGDRVAEGAVVARLDTRALEADLAARVAARDALAARRDLAELTADRQKALLDGNHVSRQRYDEARLAVAGLEAEVRAAEATITSIEIALDKAVIRAPFDAVVGARRADVGARVAGGAPVIDLFEAAAPRFRAGLPAEVAAQIAPGDALEIEIGGITHAATVERLRDDIDPVTRTRDVLLALPEGAQAADGALGHITLTREVAGTGGWVATAALGEGIRGLWTLYLVDDTGAGPVARREAVELIHLDGDRAFVRGALPDGVQIVAEGPHRVADGQRIAPSPES